MKKFCAFCEIADGGRNVSERHRCAGFVAFDSEHPRHAVHIVITPIKHTEHVQDMTRTEFSDMLMLARTLAKKHSIDSFRILVNVGEKHGQRVKHACVELFSDVVS
jgi:diadenosine tetraphosphate (Ap4A) HIT family hydrolase